MISAVRETQGELSYYICTSIDITDRKKSEERIQFLAQHDVLTELPNRSLWHRAAAHSRSCRRSAPEKVVVLLSTWTRSQHQPIRSATISATGCCAGSRGVFTDIARTGDT